MLAFLFGVAMKTFIVALIAFACAAANATAIAEAHNERGGIIELTDQPCHDQSRVASTAEANGSGKEYGCYIVRDGHVLIYWYVLQRVLTYPVGFFRPLSSS